MKYVFREKTFEINCMLQKIIARLGFFGFYFHNFLFKKKKPKLPAVIISRFLIWYNRVPLSNVYFEQNICCCVFTPEANATTSGLVQSMFTFMSSI